MIDLAFGLAIAAGLAVLDFHPMAALWVAGLFAAWTISRWLRRCAQ